MGTIKLNRRDFVKAAGAGAFYIALPNLAISNLIESDEPKSESVDSDPLVVVVKNDELVGFRGLNEFTIRDNGLGDGLSRRLGKSGSDYSENDPVVILVNGDKSIGFRGWGEFAIRDNDVARILSNKFRSNIGG